eukprot:2572459-Amphidinium_carterae.2
MASNRIIGIQCAIAHASRALLSRQRKRTLPHLACYVCQAHQRQNVTMMNKEGPEKPGSGSWVSE